MSPSSWSTPLITLGGVLLTLLVTMWIDHRKGQRDTRFQWIGQQIALYSEFLAACTELRNVQIWPANLAETPADTAPLHTRILQITCQAPFLAHRDVTKRMVETVQAAEKLTAVIAHIRDNSKPGHRGHVDDRMRRDYDNALQTYAAAIDNFVEAARADVDVRSPFGRHTYATG